METTQIQKKLTYKGNNAGAISSSMLHSLRHTDQHIKYDKQGNEIEMWDKEKVHKSFLLLDGKQYKLSELSDDEKDELTKELIKDELNDYNGNNEPEYLQEIDKQNNLVLKKKSNLKRNGELFEEFGNLKDSHISDDVLNTFIDRVNSDDDIKRKNQKIKGLQTFQEENNKLCEMRDGQQSKMDKRKGLIQESFLKFPKMPNTTIPDQKYCEILEDYYKENFPDYQIKASVFHGDEESLNDNLQDCGAHAHIFVSCKNKKTGNYDLVKQQQKQGIDYIKQNPYLFPHIKPENLKQNYNFHKSINGAPLTAEQKKENRENNKYLRAIGQAQQVQMMKFSQDKLEQYGVKLYRNTYETDEEKEKLRKLENDKKQSKQNRYYNSKNAELINAEKKELAGLKKDKAKEEDTLDIMRKTNKGLREEIDQNHETNEELKTDIGKHKSMLSKVKTELKKELKGLVKSTKSYIQQVFQKKPEEQLQEQANNTAKHVVGAIKAVPGVAKAVSDIVSSTDEKTGSDRIEQAVKNITGDKCSICSFNPIVWNNLCDDCMTPEQKEIAQKQSSIDEDKRMREKAFKKNWKYTPKKK